MASYITREYDEFDLMAKLSELRPDLKLPENARVLDIDLSMPVANGRRTVEIKVAIPLSKDEVDTLLSNPQS